MHELSLCETVVLLIEDEAHQHHFGQVKTVWLEIGRLAGVEIEAMRFAFGAVTPGTVAENAALEIVEISGQGRCPGCLKESPIQQRYDACPSCGLSPMEIVAGEEMRIRELEVQ